MLTQMYCFMKNRSSRASTLRRVETDFSSLSEKTHEVVKAAGP
jgi:hypothetical protein